MGAVGLRGCSMRTITGHVRPDGGGASIDDRLAPSRSLEVAGVHGAHRDHRAPLNACAHPGHQPPAVDGDVEGVAGLPGAPRRCGGVVQAIRKLIASWPPTTRRRRSVMMRPTAVIGVSNMWSSLIRVLLSCTQ